MSELKSMDDAPKTGFPILVWDPRSLQSRVVRWMTSLEEGDGAWVYARQLSVEHPDGVAVAFVVSDPYGWMPEPAPPTEFQNRMRA